MNSRANFFQTEIRFLLRHWDWVEVPITYHGPPKGLPGSTIKEALSILWSLRKSATRYHGGGGRAGRGGRRENGDRPHLGLRAAERGHRTALDLPFPHFLPFRPAPGGPDLFLHFSFFSFPRPPPRVLLPPCPTGRFG